MSSSLRPKQVRAPGDKIPDVSHFLHAKAFPRAAAVLDSSFLNDIARLLRYQYNGLQHTYPGRPARCRQRTERNRDIGLAWARYLSKQALALHFG